jgi:hypothetical protein
MITNGVVVYICEIKTRTAMAKAAFNMEEALFTSKLDLNLGRNW